MTEKINAFIKLFPLLSRETPSIAETIMQVSNTMVCAAKTRLYFEGDSCSHIAFILQGEIRVFKTSESGREITLYEIGPGETCILNASCILSGLSYPANAITISDCELLMVPAQTLRSLIEKHEVMRNFVFTLLSSRLTEVMTLVEEVAFGKMDERLMEYIIEKSQDDHLETTHQTIADNLGTSREVVSRLLKDFENRGKLSLSRNLIKLTI